jgi:hypothetical protein
MPLRNPLELFDRNSGAKFLMSAPKPKQREVRSGSNSEVAGLEQDVRSTLKNRHRHAGPACPKNATNGLMHCSKSADQFEATRRRWQ